MASMSYIKDSWLLTWRAKYKIELFNLEIDQYPFHPLKSDNHYWLLVYSVSVMNNVFFNTTSLFKEKLCLLTIDKRKKLIKLALFKKCPSLTKKNTDMEYCMMQIHGWFLCKSCIISICAECIYPFNSVKWFQVIA
jgi:hypothetical protein